MKAKAAQKLRNILLIVGVVIMLAAYWYEAAFMIGVIVTVSCLIPDFLYNKCPHCKKRLGRNGGQFC